MNIIAMLTPVLLALTPTQSTATIAPSTSDDNHVSLMYLVSLEEDERSPEQRYKDHVKTNRARLKELVSLKFSSELLESQQKGESEPLIPGKFRLRVKHNQIKLVWRFEDKRMELKAKENYVGLKYKSKFSLNSWFD